MSRPFLSPDTTACMPSMFVKGHPSAPLQRASRRALTERGSVKADDASMLDASFLTSSS